MPTLHYVTENRTLKDLVGASGVTKLLRYSKVIIGNGTATEFTIPHNLNSYFLTSHVFDSDTKQEMTVNKQVINANSFKIIFATPPPLSKAYDVYVMASKA